MNIVKTPKYNNLYECIEEHSSRLVESYKRTSSEKEFLNENGDTIENQIIYAFIGLNESVQNADNKFTFENGMFIPRINKRVTGRLSLTNIAESAKDEEEFIENVVHQICEDRLYFTPTVDDIKNLREHYQEYKQGKLNG